jgi:hypothetical protein
MVVVEVVSVSRAELLLDHSSKVITKALKQVLVIFLNFWTNFICLSNLHDALLIILHKFQNDLRALVNQAARSNDALKARLLIYCIVLSFSSLVQVAVASNWLALVNVEFLSRC